MASGGAVVGPVCRIGAGNHRARATSPSNSGSGESHWSRKPPIGVG